MRIRRDPIYISVEVWRWLRLLAKSESIPEENRIMTADEIADTLLRQAIREQHPTLMDHQKQIEKLEKQLIQTLRNDNTHAIQQPDAVPSEPEPSTLPHEH